MKRWIHAKENIMAKLNNSAEHYTNRIKEAYSIASSKIDVVRQFLVSDGKIISVDEFPKVVTQAAKALGYVDCACFTAVGILGALLDSLESDYTVCMGSKVKPRELGNIPKEKWPTSHCWIEVGNKIYEQGSAGHGADYYVTKQANSISSL